MAVARVRKIKVRKMPHEYSDGCTLLWMDQPASPAHPHLHPNYEDMEAGRQERRSLPPGRRRLPVRHVKTHASVQENHARDADGRRSASPLSSSAAGVFWPRPPALRRPPGATMSILTVGWFSSRKSHTQLSL